MKGLGFLGFSDNLIPGCYNVLWKFISFLKSDFIYIYVRVYTYANTWSYILLYSSIFPKNSNIDFGWILLNNSFKLFTQ